MKEIVNALTIIKKVCEENNTCYECPLYCIRIKRCGLFQRPDTLKISDPTVNIIK